MNAPVGPLRPFLHSLKLKLRARVMARIEPDANRPGMWRVRWPNGRLSDMTSLTRAKDAAACFIETEDRRQRGRQRPSEGRLCVKTDSWGKGPIATGDGVRKITTKVGGL
jgi:hypothetical protein